MNAPFTLDNTAGATLVLPSSRMAAAPRPRRRRFLVAVLLVIFAAAGIGGWLHLRPEPASAAIATITVGRGSVQETVLATGTLEASSLVSVGAQVSGIVKTVDVELGDEVKAGDSLAEIDSLDQENKLKVAQAALSNVEAQKTAAEATLSKNQRALDRANALQESKLITDTDFDTAQNNVDTARAQVAQLEAQIEQAKLSVSSAELDLDRTKITAPSAGTVVAVLVDPGQTVNANQSAPTLVKIANLDTMLVNAEISEADVTRVAAGQKVSFTVLGDPDKPISATLRSINPAPTSIAEDNATSTDAVYYNAIFEVPNPSHSLRIDMTAKVTIILDAASDVLTLPASALGTRTPEGNYSLEVVDPATGARETPKVTVGLNNKVTAQITGGLAEGDKVVSTVGKSAAATTAATGNRAGGAFGMGGPGMGL